MGCISSKSTLGNSVSKVEKPHVLDRGKCEHGEIEDPMVFIEHKL